MVKVNTVNLDLSFELINKLSAIDRFSGEWSTIERREGVLTLKQLKAIATVQSVGASTRIEGSKLTNDEIQVLLFENLTFNKLEERDTSGTSVDFTSIPSWVKRITVMLNRVSTNGTSFVQVQIGSGSITTTGYVSSASLPPNSYASTTGLMVYGSDAADSRTGTMTLTLIGSNTWISSGNIIVGTGQNQNVPQAGISPALGGALDRIRLTTVNGTDTFDAGSVNILYE